MAYGLPLLACNTFLPTPSQHSWLYHNSVICIYHIRIFFLSVHASLHTHHHVQVVSLCTSYYNGFSAFLMSEHIYISLYWCSLPDLGFLLLSIRQCCQGHSFQLMLCFVLHSASHAHALGPPQGPIYLPLGRTLSILVSTNNVRDAHNAWVFTLLCTLHCHLLISGLVRGIGHGISLAMPY